MGINCVSVSELLYLNSSRKQNKTKTDASACHKLQCHTQGYTILMKGTFLNSHSERTAPRTKQAELKLFKKCEYA